MLNNNSFEVIPKEAFEMADHVANNLIDKVCSVCGWIVQPKGKRSDKEEAVKSLIKEIQENKNLDTLAKAACISNARKILKEYCNQCDIMQIALDNLNEDAKPEDLDDDWLDFFMDKAKNISNKDVQIMFGKLLAEECNDGDVTKSLILKLTIMEKDLADAFNKLCEYVVKACAGDDKGLVALIPSTALDDLKKYHIDMKFNDFFELETAGLLKIDEFEYGYLSSELECEYQERKYKLTSKADTKDKPFIKLGKIKLTTDGEILAKQISSVQSSVYFTMIKKYFEDNGVVVEEIG